MPHLQVASVPSDGPVDQKKVSDADKPENDSVRAEADVLLTLAATASKKMQGSEKQETHDSSHTAEEPSYGSQRKPINPGPTSLHAVTPSPFKKHGPEGYRQYPRGYEAPGWTGSAGHSPSRYATYGRGNQESGAYSTSNQRLFTSPTRASRQNEFERHNPENMREVKPEEDLSNGSCYGEAGRVLQYRPDMARPPYYAPPPNMMPFSYGYRYPPQMLPHAHGYDERYMYTCSPTRTPPKRPLPEDATTQNSPKRKQRPEENLGESKGVIAHSVPSDQEKAHKQRVISPTSSLECHSKNDEDDSAKLQDSPPRVSEESSPVRHPPHSPYSCPPVVRHRFSPHHYCNGPPGTHLMHPGYHLPHSEAWRTTPPVAYSHGPPIGPPRGPTHPPPYPHPHPYGHPQAGYPYPLPGMYPPHHQRTPLRNPIKLPTAAVPRTLQECSESSADASRPLSTSPKVEQSVAPNIKSVAEWQQATLATGRAPSANRCMALKAPIPSKYWGEAEKAKDTPVPDFHRLVNYPDYLTKSRPNGTELATHNGKRNCVMCGKLRVCSASTASLSGGNALRRSKGGKDADDEASVGKSVADDTNNDSTHIIPRQNKGLCTGCDVTVWVVAENKLEIKWCKGCKNFRPWASFGDKGSATKCVRCRDRQREKYAMQKDELRIRRTKVAEEKRDDADHEMAAAKGLRDLMAMGATSL